MLTQSLLAISTIAQLATAVLAFRVVHDVRKRLPWILIGTGFLLMGVRRAIALSAALTGHASHPAETATEVVAMLQARRRVRSPGRR